ncbi:MAG TPA: DeoR/GlpR family DNA-binding transcription regulator, partial [Deinococcales bacterium]|nr:DeoR/GlpR family DNA-binding transcription regulator [Deinococcales bacterium]
MPDTRRKQIVQLLELERSVRVEDLAERFAVSPVTIRKDLAELEARGLLERTHGGATLTHRSRYNPSFREKLHQHGPQKRQVALAALQFVQEGDAVILDAGSSTLALAQAIKGEYRSLVVLTNSVAIALELVDTPNEVLLLGGQVRQHSLALIGPAAVSTVEGFRADKVFLGATGVSLEAGYTTPNPLEAQTKRAMLLAASERYVLADASKIGHAALSRFARLDEVSALIT